MVHGLDKFRQYFAAHTNQYVFIGGTACDLLLGELGASFRATKDLDIVLIIEALDASFGKSFWQFISDGGYQNRGRGSGSFQFYRFSQPKDNSFPKMIELFSRPPNNFELLTNQQLAPIHIDESIVSLSVILLSEAYYALLIDGKRTLEGYSTINIETIILFKMKAWLDLKKRKAAGENIDSRNIIKHKNDVFRLLRYISPTSRVELVSPIKHDVISFIEQMNDDPPDLKNLGIKQSGLDEMTELIDRIYL